MIIKPKIYLFILILITFLNNYTFCQFHKDYEYGFITELNNEDIEDLQFVEDTLFNITKTKQKNIILYAGYPGFISPLDVDDNFFNIYKQKKNTNKYFIDISWENSFRNFAILSFSRMYSYKKEDYRTKEIMIVEKPLLKTKIDSYNKLFQKKDIELINLKIKETIIGSIDSNFVTINGGSLYKVQRIINSETYNIFPQSPLSILINLIKDRIMDGSLTPYYSDLLKTPISKVESKSKYFGISKGIPVIGNNGEIISYDTVLINTYCNSVQLSENVEFKIITDSLELFNYPYFQDFPYDTDSSSITTSFAYNAIGVNYKFDYMSPTKTAWINYNEVKNIIEKNNVNFDLYEAIFTKNLFDILEITNEYWQKSDYKK